MKTMTLVLIAIVAFLGTTGCKSATGPDVESLMGTWNATKAEFVSVADSDTKVNIITLGSTLTLVLNSDTFVLTITDPGEDPFVSSGTWSNSMDTITLTWASGFFGESQFDFVLDGDELELEGGHLPFEFTPGNSEEAILNLILHK